MGEEAQATISFRAMTEADIPALVAIEAQSFYDAWNENMLRNEIANELTTYLVMECAGKLVGYAGFWLVAGEAQITRVAVATNKFEVKATSDYAGGFAGIASLGWSADLGKGEGGMKL